MMLENVDLERYNTLSFISVLDIVVKESDSLVKLKIIKFIVNSKLKPLPLTKTKSEDKCLKTKNVKLN